MKKNSQHRYGRYDAKPDRINFIGNLNLQTKLALGVGLVAITGVALINFGLMPNVNMPSVNAATVSQFSQAKCTNTQTFLADNNSGYSINSPTVCGSSRISGKPVIHMIPADNPDELLGSAEVTGARNEDGELTGCEVGNIAIRGNDVTKEEFEAIAGKELATVKACNVLAVTGILPKYDTKRDDDLSEGLGYSIQTIDGQTMLELYADQPGLAKFILGGAPPWVIEIIEKGIKSGVGNCEWAEAIKMLGDNGIVLSQSQFDAQVQAMCR